MVEYLHQDGLAQKGDMDGAPKALMDQLLLVIMGTQIHLMVTLRWDDPKLANLPQVFAFGTLPLTMDVLV